MNKSDLKNLIKQILQEELIDEMSTTGGAAGAGSGAIQRKDFWKPGKGTNPNEDESDAMKKNAKKSMPPQRNSNIVNEEDPADLNEARSRYKNFKTSEKYKKPHSKLSYAVLEMKKMLREVNFLVDVATRLRTETDVPTSKYWNRTVTDLLEIEKFAKQISKKTRNLK